jgi:adenosylcobinamide-phosphate synthase
MPDSAAITLIAAYALDLVIGDPPYPLHPVRLLGGMIAMLERTLRQCRIPQTVGAWVLPAVTVATGIGTYLSLRSLLGGFAPLLDIYLAYSLLALRDLLKHGQKVEDALRQQHLPKARNSVQMLVGRNTEELSHPAIARAAIESLAENTVDGVVSPVFWYAVGSLICGSTGGIVLLVAFKTVSTLDSMIGYKNERYNVLGRISARFDDALNFIPARLAIPLIALSAMLCGGRAKEAWRIGWRDRLNHDSPNSAHAEAAIAGALGLWLGGPATYDGKTVMRPWIGNGTPEASSRHIARSRHILFLTGTISVALAASLLFVIATVYTRFKNVSL